MNCYHNRTLFLCRKRFSISVNCWFCNSNTKVPYSQQDSFSCPNCLQYNGFSEDGTTGYNREIAEQHFSKLNTANTLYCRKSDQKIPSINGLCEGCNRNQEMKVIQLANFKPKVERKYDEEVEEYRQKLEDSYQLCQQCQRHLNKTLIRVKTKFIGSKITQLASKGVKVVKSLNNTKDRQVLSKIVMISVFILSVINLMKEINIKMDYLRSISNESMMNFYYHIVALRLTVMDLLKNLLDSANLPNWTEENVDPVASSAILLNIFLLFSQRCVRVQIIVSMLFWSLTMVMDEVPIDPSYQLAVKGSIAAVSVLASVLMLKKSIKPKESTVDFNSSFHKIHTDQDCLEDSDNDEDLSPSSSYNFDSRSVRSSLYAPSNSLYGTTMTQFNSFRDKTVKTIPHIEFLNGSSLNKTFHNSTLRRHNATLNPLSVTLSSHNASITHKVDPFVNRSFSIRSEVAACDRKQVQKEINRLNISGNNLGSTSTLKDFPQSIKSLNPFSLENSRCGSPTLSIASVFSGSQRTQVISPPRLEPTNIGEANKSWVAGGYWSSPQKRYIDVNHIAQCQKMSRSSSQSSGLGTTESGKNSRENSICYDDIPSIYSEPVRRRNLFEQPPDTRSLHGGFFSQTPKANNLFVNSNVSNFRKYR